MQGLLTHTVCGHEIKFYEKFAADPFELNTVYANVNYYVYWTKNAYFTMV